MSGNILLCRDGILRFKHWFYDSNTGEGEMYYFSHSAYEKLVSNAFLKHLDNGFDIEENLTAGELFRNLEPYSDVLEGLCGMDFAAFVEEAKKPPVDLSDRGRFSHIDVKGYFTLDAVPDFERIDKEEVEPDVDGKYYSSEAMSRSLGIGAAKITDQLELQEMWTNSAVLRTPEYDENTDSYIYEYSIDYTPVSQWAHLPIKVNQYMEFRDMTGVSDYLSSNQSVLNPDHPLVRKDKFGLTISVDNGGPTFNQAIIQGCLKQWGFHYSPEIRDERMAEIEQAVDEIDEVEGSKRTEQDEDKVQENIRDIQRGEDASEKEALETLLEIDEHGYKK